MTASRSTHSRRLLVPSILQSSETDSAPAALQALLNGFYLQAHPERVHELWHGTADENARVAIQRVAAELGLALEQELLPADHLLLAESAALPALLHTREPDEPVHFIVVWNHLGNWVQVMDPARGRRWISRQEFFDLLSVETQQVSVTAWRDNARKPEFLDALRHRLRALHIRRELLETWITRATEDPAWDSLARLDATTRMVEQFVRAGAIQRGNAAARVVERFMLPTSQGTLAHTDDRLDIPSRNWSVRAHGDSDTLDTLIQRGVFVLRVRPGTAPETATQEQTPPLRRETVSQRVALRPETRIIALLRADGLLMPTVLALALVLATLGVMIQALLFQGLLNLTALVHDQAQQLTLLGAIFIFVFALFAVEVPINNILLRMGRRLEMRFRISFLEKLPRLGDRFFQGHEIADMIQRAHSLRQLHLLPELGVQLLRTGFQLGLTTLGIIWLEPRSALLAVLATGSFLALAFYTAPILQTRDLRMRTQLATFSRFYLDAMLGLVPLKMHGAARGYRRENEGLLHTWARVNWDMAHLANVLQALGVFVYALFAVWLVGDYVSQYGTTTGTLLLFFWVLSLPVLATALVQSIQQYPALRNLTMRVIEPLDAPDENIFQPESIRAEESKVMPGSTPRGVAVAFDRVGVQLGGSTILTDITLTIQPGEQVAIVGPSGAGKTTLVGVLLGWHTPVTGECRIDGELVSVGNLARLRREMVWVDPAVQLWNRSLWENVMYGNAPRAVASPSRAIEAADLLEVIEQLESGLETQLGEGGGLVSGGEGQRVRLARAMNRAGVRLVILDEPFRGLDRATRRKLLARAREFWRGATLVCVTHDVSETQAFEQVVVIENGRIVEAAPPAQLAANPHSRYRVMLDDEEQVREGLWSSAEWRRLWIQDGELRQEKSAAGPRDAVMQSSPVGD